MAEAAEPTGEPQSAEVKPQSAEVKTQQPAEKGFRAPHRRVPCSVLKVSQLLLGAITSHKGLTLAALKKELGNAGYEVRRKYFRPSGEAAQPEARSTLLRVSGSDAAGYFRVWKVPKPKRKPKFVGGSRASRKTPARPRGPRRRRPRRQAARRARQVWRRSARAEARAKRARPQPKRQRRPGARAAAGGASKPGRREEKRPGSKPKAEKHAGKRGKRAVPKPSPLKTDRPSSEQGKTSEPGAAGAKAPVRSKGSWNATGSS
ncbi:testis-specific H1 histone-like [Dasypus novemcinctus]|uniref:testis-specific H1 histone-like n=1 Tax=Dasypus novemcinctus TaxID=9361 RepID=UPI00265E4005|nr:testis-specific H1 histone-like [Dasypus novemcinctus]